MIDKMRAASDQLRRAWHNYLFAYAWAETGRSPRKTPQVPRFSPELIRHLDKELGFIASYERGIQEIKVAISSVRNYSLGRAPIHSLPPEILIHIFQLVIAKPPSCNLHDLSDSPLHWALHKYPDALAQVCSFWRTTALSACSLWSHIDLTSSTFCHNLLVTRAETHVARAGNLPIELHILESRLHVSEGPLEYYNRSYRLISDISGRVKTLELVMDGYLQGFRSSVIKQLLLHQHPALTKLVLCSKHGFPGRIISSYSNSRKEDENFKVDLTETEIEVAFACFKILHLRGIFPPWHSKAFHGLTDLRLLSVKEWSVIGLNNLRSILEANPGLQILHFGLRIEYPVPPPSRINPVQLRDLQVVKIFPGNGHWINLRPSRLLRLLAPGSKSLALSFSNNYEPSRSLFLELEAFFKRARVTRFYSRIVFPPLGILLRHSAHLERVVLDYLEYDSREGLPPTWRQEYKLGSLPRLRSLYITRSALSEADLRLLADCCPNGTVLQSSSIKRDSGGVRMRFSAEEVSHIFPTVRTTEYASYHAQDPTADWDILD